MSCWSAVGPKLAAIRVPSGDQVIPVNGLVRGTTSDSLNFRFHDEDKQIKLEKLVGVSLAVAALDETGFEVALVAYTLAETGLGTLPAGDEVNLEADVLGKYVERLLAQTREA